MAKDKYKPCSAKRWTDISVPEVIGHTEYTPEEKEQNDRDMEHIMREYGFLGLDEKIENGNVVKINNDSDDV